MSLDSSLDTTNAVDSALDEIIEIIAKKKRKYVKKIKAVDVVEKKDVDVVETVEKKEAVVTDSPASLVTTLSSKTLINEKLKELFGKKNLIDLVKNI